MKYYRSNSIFQENSLAHFGIFGMKWGVRRFQNEDGTLTEEGKKRYSNREKDVEYAKRYAQSEAEKDKKSLSFWKGEAKKSQSMPATKEGIKKRIKISDEDYEDYLREYKTPEGVKKSIIQNDLSEAKIYQRRLQDWNKKLKALEKVKVDAVMSDKQHKKQIDDIFTQAQGWLLRKIDLFHLHSFMDRLREKDMSDVEKSRRLYLMTENSRIAQENMQRQMDLHNQMVQQHINTMHMHTHMLNTMGHF